MDAGSEALVTPLRYDDALHEYIDTSNGLVLPNITSMLEQTGWIDSRWYTEESSERGTAVHRLALDYDLDAVSLDTVRGKYRGYLLAWSQMMSISRATWDHLEEPFIHPRLRFGGRPDRVGTCYGQLAVGELKTGDFEKSHPVQTALQAILVGSQLNLPPEAFARFGFYVKPDGKFKMEQFINAVDIRNARKVLRECCGV